MNLLWRCLVYRPLWGPGPCFLVQRSWMPEPIICMPLGTDRPPVTGVFASLVCTELAMRRGKEVQLRTPLYGATDFSQEGLQPANPIILWKETGTCAHTFVLAHLHPSPHVRGFVERSGGLTWAGYMNEGMSKRTQSSKYVLILITYDVRSQIRRQMGEPPPHSSPHTCQLLSLFPPSCDTHPLEVSSTVRMLSTSRVKNLNPHSLNYRWV